MYFQKTEKDFCQTGEEKYDIKVAYDVPKMKFCCKLLVCEKEAWYF